MFPTQKKYGISVICAISGTDTPGIHTSQGEPNLEVNLGPTQPSYHLMPLVSSSFSFPIVAEAKVVKTGMAAMKSSSYSLSLSLQRPSKSAFN
jgi:hypothetical protein